eukprot:5776607-Amphidinium_carterae.1
MALLAYFLSMNKICHKVLVEEGMASTGARDRTRLQFGTRLCTGVSLSIMTRPDHSIRTEANGTLCSS